MRLDGVEECPYPGLELHSLNNLRKRASGRTDRLFLFRTAGDSNSVLFNGPCRDIRAEPSH